MDFYLFLRQKSVAKMQKKSTEYVLEDGVKRGGRNFNFKLFISDFYRPCGCMA